MQWNATGNTNYPMLGEEKNGNQLIVMSSQDIMLLLYPMTSSRGDLV